MVTKFNDRVEFHGPLYVEGKVGQIFVSYGQWDDYLELELPEGFGPTSKVCADLVRVPSETPEGQIDVRVHDGDPVSIGVSALYVGDPSIRDRPHDDRLTAILSTLVRAVPALDFGELLPGLPLPEPFVEAPFTLEPEESAGDIPSLSEGPTRALFLGTNQNEERIVPESTPKPREDFDSKKVVALFDSQAGRERAKEIKANLERAKGLIRRGQTHKAIRSIEDILRQEPAHVEALLLRQDLALVERREKRVKREPRNVRAILEVGTAYLQLACEAKAVEAFAQACLIDPDPFLAHILLGVTKHRQGDVAAARRAYEKAASLHPADPTPGELLADLLRGVPPPPITESRIPSTGPDVSDASIKLRPNLDHVAVLVGGPLPGSFKGMR